MSAATEEKKRRILDAARRLLVRHGFQDLALDEVAREAGVAKGTLFLYFKSKDALFSAAFADLMDGLGAELGPEVPLEQAVRAILGYLDRYHDFSSQFSLGRFPGCGDRSCGRLQDKMRENMRRVVVIVERHGRSSGRPPKDPEWSALTLFGLCRSAFLYERLASKKLSLEERTRRVIDTFYRGIGAQG